jgi:hypothetical protein
VGASDMAEGGGDEKASGSAPTVFTSYTSEDAAADSERRCVVSRLARRIADRQNASSVLALPARYVPSPPLPRTTSLRPSRLGHLTSTVARIQG